jgi:O-antigen/teichoic acid export membrane protein
MGYGIGQFGRGLVIYLTLPLLTRLIGPAEYGAIAVMAAFISFTDVLSDAGLPAATFRFYHDSNDSAYQSRVLGSSLVLFVTYALVMAAGVYVAAEPLSRWLLSGPGYAGLFQIGAALMVALTLVSFCMILYRIQIRPVASSLAVLFMVTVQTGLALAFVALYGLGAYGYWWGQLIGAVLTVLFMLIGLRRSLHFSLSIADMKRLTTYALPLIPASLSMWALRLADRPLIEHFVGLQAAGIYDVGYKVASLLMVAITPFTLAWPPFAFAHMKDPDAPDLYRDVLTAMATVCTLLGIGIFALRRELVLLFGSIKYVGAVSVVGWVVVGQIALALYLILSIGPRITKRTNQIAAVCAIAAVMNIALNILLLPRFGIVGAAFATMIAYVILAALVYAFGRRQFRFPLDFRRLGILLLAAMISIGCILLVESYVPRFGLALLLRVLSMPLFVGVLFATGFISPAQVREIVKFGSEQLRQRVKGSTGPEL